MASESKSSGGIVHQQKEKYEDALNAAIPEADSIAAAGRLAEAVDTLMAVEKRARLVRAACLGRRVSAQLRTGPPTR